MKQTTRLLSLLLVLVLCLSVLPMGAMAMIEDGWQKIDGYWYYYEDGSPLTNNWVEDPDGSDNWYRLGPDGKMITSAWTSDSDGEYYQLSSGKSAMGWLKLDGVWYYFDPGNYGAAVSGWQKIGGSWYWFYIPDEWNEYPGHAMVSDYWLEDPADSNTWYYFGSNGKMVTSQWVKDPWTDDEGTTHYSWYYQLSSGKSAMGWLKLGGVWYYFDPDDYGEMATGGPYEIDGNYYFFKDSGAMRTGWISYEGGWSYCTSNGVFMDGWKKIGGSWYYFEDGFIYTGGPYEIDGRLYFFKTSGALFTGWKESENGWMYFTSNGAVEYGWKQINGKWYQFENRICLNP